MGKMLNKYKNVSSSDFNEERFLHRFVSGNGRLNKGKFNSLSEWWFCFLMNKRIDKLKRKVLVSNKKFKA